MANRYDAARLEADAQRLEVLARTARSNMLSRTTEKATRLGADGERVSREARAADAQRAEADQLVGTHHAEAARFETKAQVLEQQARRASARGDAASRQEAVELREEAAKAREGAAVARGKAQIAGDDAKRLQEQATELRAKDQAIDAELAAMSARLVATELSVDQLEWHAEKARAMADTVSRADDLQAQAATATARGDRVAAAEHGRRAASLRDEADVLAFVRERPPFPVDHAALEEIGVTVSPDDLSVPMPELIDPYSPMGPLAAASSVGGGEQAVAAATTTERERPIVGDASAADEFASETSFAATSSEPLSPSLDIAPLPDPPLIDERPFDEPVIADTTFDGFGESSLA